MVSFQIMNLVSKTLCSFAVHFHLVDLEINLNNRLHGFIIPIEDICVQQQITKTVTVKRLQKLWNVATKSQSWSEPRQT